MEPGKREKNQPVLWGKEKWLPKKKKRKTGGANRAGIVGR